MTQPNKQRGVFLSAVQSSAIAARVAEQLRDHGVQVTTSDPSMTSAEALRWITDCAAVLTIADNAYYRTSYLACELEHAVSLREKSGKPAILVVRLVAGSPPPLYAGFERYADFVTHTPSEAVQRVLAELRVDGHA